MDPFFSVGKLGEYTLVEFKTASLMNPTELERIAQGLYRLVDEDGAKLVLMDFTPVEYLSSQAIGMVVGLHKKVSQIPGGKLALCGVGPQLLQLLKITRLDRLLKVFKTQKEAVK
ncbi:MAG: anti-anti-sigma factor [Phycisphaerales bacterium]|jgi:anti-sigma B factor antagonist|nr:anti-anti-sigma factor [Phycisphaerales bacterium]MDB5298998.1 anti-anti-sigma factor [Phycisphaerales bacterium]MDB5303548.1 anti-anti-sigma factor [Phycisphaerales bacterium]